MTLSAVREQWPGDSNPDHDSAMNQLLRQNLAYLMDREKLRQHGLAREAGVSQRSVGRILNGEVDNPTPGTVEAIAKRFNISPDTFRNKDVKAMYERIAAGKSADTVMARPIAVFAPRDRSGDPDWPIRNLELSRSWFDARFGYDPERCGLAVMPDTSMASIIEVGEIVLIDTGAVEPVRGKNEIFAFTYFGEPYIQYLVVTADGYRYFGTNKIHDSVPIIGDEADGLRICGKVKDKVSFTKL